MGQHFGRAQRAKAPGPGKAEVAGQAVQEAGGIEIAGAGRIDQFFRDDGIDDMDFVAADDDRTLFRPG